MPAMASQRHSNAALLAVSHLPPTCSRRTTVLSFRSACTSSPTLTRTQKRDARGSRGTLAAMQRPLQSTIVEAKDAREDGRPCLSSGFVALSAAALLWSATCQQGIAAEMAESVASGACEIASLADVSLTGMVQLTSSQMLMGGMTAEGFDPARYSGRWYEVASLKRGFAGQGQEDCHCTQGVYSFDEASRAIQVDTFCVHGSPSGYITGIRGSVSCVPESQLMKLETALEREEMIREKCFLRFPSIPFIPKLPYDVIATDYDTYALVSGAKDTSFIQIYSRTPNPGVEFIAEKRAKLKGLGFDAESITDTPQDCPVLSMEALGKMMSGPGAAEAMVNKLPVAMSDLSVAIELPKGSNYVTESLKSVSKLLVDIFK